MCTGAIRSALAVSDALALLLHRLSAAAQMAAYGGFYTRQEQEDALAARIENPNRVGSGIVNYGAQERQLQPATNWQTGNLVGGASVGNTPAQVSDIWNSQSAAPPQQRMQAGQQMQQQQMQQQLAQQNYGAAPPQRIDGTAASRATKSQPASTAATTAPAISRARRFVRVIVICSCSLRRSPPYRTCRSCPRALLAG